MPKITVPTSNIGQNSVTFRGSTSQSQLAYIKGPFTYPTQGSGPYLIRGSFSNPYAYFWLFVYTNNSSWGSVSIIYPWSETSSGSSPVGANNQVYTGVYGYITIRGNPSYGRSFSYWSATNPGGPVVSYSSTYSMYENDTYYNSSIYANFT
jgi:hypothetical protein